MGSELLSQAFDSAPTEPPSTDPRMEPISAEITDTPIMTENVSSIFEFYWSILLDFLIHCYSHLLFGYSLSQTSFDETFVQEQEPSSSPVGNDPIDLGNSPVAGVQTDDPPTRHAPDGKEAIRLFPSQRL